jgi:sensor histidine kinase regulating citrate/malate metabolism
MAKPRVDRCHRGDLHGAVAWRITALASPDVRDQLFRVPSSRRRNTDAPGLASSRAIAESHQGSLGLENVEGGGTRFCLRLPACANEEEVPT